jgi:uncharacterized phage-associated protein
MAEYRKFEFDRQKFKDLILYFSKRGADEGLIIGSTKLNKLLFFTDFKAFAERGHPVTGARYQKLQYGPAARALLPVRKEMIEDEEIAFRGRSDDEWNDVLTPVNGTEPKTLSEDDRRIADEVFEDLRPFNATATSDYSHLKSAGWKVVALGEDIPYESAYVVTDPAPPEAIELGRELAAKYGW